MRVIDKILLFGIEKRILPIIKFSLWLGGDLQARNEYNLTIFQLVYKNFDMKYKDIFEYIADKNIKAFENKKLSIVNINLDKSDEEKLYDFMTENNFAHINDIDFLSNSPIIVAVLDNNLEIVKILLKKSIKINTIYINPEYNNSESNLLSIAFACHTLNDGKNYLEIMSLLIDEGINLETKIKNSNNENRTILQIAITTSQFDLAKFFVSKGAKLNEETLKLAEEFTPNLGNELEKIREIFCKKAAHDQAFKLFNYLSRISNCNELPYQVLCTVGKHLDKDNLLIDNSIIKLTMAANDFAKKKYNNLSNLEKAGRLAYNYVPTSIYKYAPNFVKNIVNAGPSANFQDIINLPEQQEYTKARILR